MNMSNIKEKLFTGTMMICGFILGISVGLILWGVMR